jgi:hypothetical protein
MPAVGYSWCAPVADVCVGDVKRLGELASKCRGNVKWQGSTGGKCLGLFVWVEWG